MVFFWVGMLCTYLLALFSLPRLGDALGPRLWRIFCTIALEYIGDGLMDINTTMLPGVLVLKPRRFADVRGYFVETYNAQAFRQSGIMVHFVQDNQSFSLRKGTVRGLHFQLPPAAQAKLIRVLRGSIFDVVVDLRLGSPTYGQWITEEVSAEGGEQIFVPRGFAHGFCTLEPNTEVAYQVDSYYAAASENGIIWTDSSLNIPWPVGPDEAILSEKDRELGTFQDLVSPFHYARHADA
jgi:dTDP-4-dehydrorhamnose 3,5-epimerase